jgi:hypothetical protein
MTFARSLFFARSMTTPTPWWWRAVAWILGLAAFLAAALWTSPTH